MELLETVGEFGKHILSIVALAGLVLGGSKYIPKWYRWVRSWKIVKRKELERLKAVEARTIRSKPEAMEKESGDDRPRELGYH